MFVNVNVRYSLEIDPYRLQSTKVAAVSSDNFPYASATETAFMSSVHCRLRHDTISYNRNACCKSVGLHAELDGQCVEHE